MSPKLALTIGAVLATVFGLAFTLIPSQMLGGFGLDTPSVALVISRDIGVTLIGLGIIDWLGREATGQLARALLLGNLFVQVAEAVVNGWEVATGILLSAAAGGVVLHVILAVVFALGLRRVA